MHMCGTVLRRLWFSVPSELSLGLVVPSCKSTINETNVNETKQDLIVIGDIVHIFLKVKGRQLLNLAATPTFCRRPRTHTHFMS